MNRRHFAFWFSFGLFTLADRLKVYGLDELAAAMMRDDKSPAKLLTLAQELKIIEVNHEGTKTRRHKEL